LACALTAFTSATAETVSIGANKDNTLYEDFLGRFSSGAGPSLFVGITGGGFIRRGVVQFDVASAVPAGATVTGATMTLFMDRTVSGAQDQVMHRLLADWGEAGSVASGGGGGGGAALPGDATWLHGYFDTTFWDNEGGDFNPAVSATQSVSGIGSYSWTSAQLAADVQDMLDNPGDNFGWIIIGTELGGVTAKRFATKENGSVVNRPRLEIAYTMAAECVGDLNGDLVIDTADLGILISQFGTAGPEADLNDDNLVDTADLGILIGLFGSSCP